MDKMTAFCGIICTECPAFLATQKDDDDIREKTADMWSKQYSAEIKPEDINCDGCLSESGEIFSYCRVCEIRKCGMEKGIENCAYCDDYACENLEKFIDNVPEAKALLEEIRKNLSSD